LLVSFCAVEAIETDHCLACCVMLHRGSLYIQRDSRFFLQATVFVKQETIYTAD